MKEELRRFGANAHLCGMLVLPDTFAAPENARDRPAVIFVTAGLLHKPGPYRLYVELSRALGAAGFPALRFDLSGIGESARRVGNASAGQAAVMDVRDAMDALADEFEIRHFILAGLCSGAEIAHQAAVADSRVTGVVAMDGYITRTARYYWSHYLPRIFSLPKWKNFISNRVKRWRAGTEENGTLTPEEEALAFWDGPGASREQLAAEFRSLCTRRVRQLQIFSGGERNCSYEGQFQDAFRDVDFNALLDVKYLSETDHLYVLNADRRRLVRVIMNWFHEHFALYSSLATTPGAARRRERAGRPVCLSRRSDESQRLKITARRIIE